MDLSSQAVKHGANFDIGNSIRTTWYRIATRKLYPSILLTYTTGRKRVISIIRPHKMSLFAYRALPGGRMRWALSLFQPKPLLIHFGLHQKKRTIEVTNQAVIQDWVFRCCWDRSLLSMVDVCCKSCLLLIWTVQEDEGHRYFYLLPPPVSAEIYIIFISFLIFIF